MEVTHLQESDNHVVIGGAKAKGFSISTSPEFIEVLSSSLYADKPLAVMREVMCNQWDAHITAGRKDKPIEITIEEDKIIFRDYGNGIADDMMEDVYCTYGESTKRSETATTGGFGLGSKSPFAISDTFTVTSMHNGIKTIYAVSKGSEVTDHLPSLTPVVSIPTTESGLLVELPIKLYCEENCGGISDFLNLAIKVAKYGQMRATIKYEDRVKEIYGDEIGLASTDMGFVVVPQFDHYRDARTRIYVQYGAVIYPLESKEFYSDEYATLNDALAMRPRHAHLPTYQRGNIIIKAPDSMLSVAPSRETLSYNKQTMTTIRDLLTNINKMFGRIRPDYMLKAMDHAFKECFLALELPLTNFTELKKIYKTANDISDSTTISIHEAKFINTVADLDAYFLASRYKTSKSFFRSYFYKKTLKYVQSFKLPRYTKYFKMLRKQSKRNLYTDPQSVELQYYCDLASDMYKEFGNTYIQYVQRYMPSYYDPRKVSMRDIITKIAYEEFSPDKFIIAKSQSSLKNYLKKVTYGGNIVTAYIIPDHKKSPDKVALTEWLEAQGCEVKRLFETTDYDNVKAPKTAGTSKPVAVGSRTGYALLSESCTPNGTFRYGMFQQAQRTKTPDSVVYLRQSGGEKYVQGISNGTQLQIVKRLLPNAVVASTYDVAGNIMKKYNVMLANHAITQILKDKMTEQSFIDSMIVKITQQTRDAEFYSQLAAIPDVAAEFGFGISNVTAVNEDIELWEQFSNRLDQVTRSTFLNSIRAIVDATKVSLPNFDLVEKRKEYLQWLPLYKISTYANQTPEIQQALSAMIIAALKG